MNRKRISTFLTGFLCCLLAAGAGIEAAGDQAPQADASQTISVSQNVKLEVEGESFVPKSKNGRELPVFLYDGAAYAPVRALADRLNYSVVYSSSERTVRMEPSPKPEEVEKDFLAENLKKRMALVKTIEFRDQEGRKAVVDALADPDPDDACFSWIHRLAYYQKVINENGEKPEDYQGSGIDVVFLDEDGDCVCKYEDVSRKYMTYLGDYYETTYGILDIERIRRVLDGKPEEFEPEKLVDIGEAAWITINNWGKTVCIDDPEIIAKITEQFNSLECIRADDCYGWIGLQLHTVTWYDEEGHAMDSVSFNSNLSSQIVYGEFFHNVAKGQLDADWLKQLFEEYPKADLSYSTPILDIGYRLPEADHFVVMNGDQTAKVTVSDPDLLKRVADHIGGIDFRVGKHLTTDPYAPADDGRIFLGWLKNNGPEEEDGAASFLFPLCILDDRNIQFSYWEMEGNEYEAAAMDGKTIDKQLLDDLLDPNGPYADNPQVVYEKLK